MFTDLDSIYSELHRKALLEQAEIDRLARSVKSQRRRNRVRAQGIGEWTVEKARQLRIYWGVATSMVSHEDSPFAADGKSNGRR